MMKFLKTHQNWFTKLFKFSLVGAFVTTLSLSANFVLLKYFETPLNPTYISVYAISILISFLLNSTMTFSTAITFSNLVRYYTIYLSSMLLGVVLLNIFNYLFNFENWVYPFMVIPFTTLWNFTIANKKLKVKPLQNDSSI